MYTPMVPTNSLAWGQTSYNLEASSVLIEHLQQKGEGDEHIINRNTIYKHGYHETQPFI